MKTRLISTTFAVLAGVGLVSSLAACGQQVASADVGACIVSADLPDDLTDFPTVDCSEAHDMQVIGKFDLADGDYPGEDAITEEANAGCADAWTDFVGISYEETTLPLAQISYAYPTPETWDKADDREILCLAIASEDVTESWEGAAV